MPTQIIVELRVLSDKPFPPNLLREITIQWEPDRQWSKGDKRVPNLPMTHEDNGIAFRYKKEFEKEILLVNNEAHRFAIAFHKKKRGKNFS